MPHGCRFRITGGGNRGTRLSGVLQVFLLATGAGHPLLSFAALPPSYLEAPALSAYDFDSTGFTVEFWIRVRSKPGFDPRIVHITNPHPNHCGYEPAMGFSVSLCNLSDCSPGTVVADITAEGACSFVATTVRVDDGEYHHVAATYDGSSLCIFMDGVLSAEGPGARTALRTSGGTIVVGNAVDYRNAFDGEIDELRLWRGARTEAEIQAFRNRELTEPLPDTLVGYWPMNGEGSDRAPSRNPLVPHNDVVFLPGRLHQAAHVLNHDALRGELLFRLPDVHLQSGNGR